MTINSDFAHFVTGTIKNTNTSKYRQKQKESLRWCFFWGGIVGAVVCVGLYGIRIIDVTYVDWLKSAYHGDPQIYQIGFGFFRNENWRFPPGMMLDFPLASGTSILYLDALPLFAIPFKLFRGILPPKFQYWGLWALFCFTIQGGFACCILKKHLHKISICVAITPLFLLAAPLLDRSYIHMALAGQWLLFFAIFIWVYKNEFFYNTKRQIIAWGSASALSIWIQTYFIIQIGFMMLGFLLADWMEKRNLKGVILVFVSSVVSTIGSFWFLGGFSASSTVKVGGIGRYSMNLLSLFDSDGWSNLLPDLPSTDGNYEGWQYLGIGGILLLIAATLIIIYRAALTDKWLFDLKGKLFKSIPVVLVFFALGVIALSPKVVLGTTTILDYSRFVRLYADFMSFFRCTGRSFWVCTYIILFFATITVFQYIKKTHLSLVIAALLVVVQVYDLYPLIKDRAQKVRREVVYESPLLSDFWTDIAQEVNHVSRLAYAHWGLSEHGHIEFYALENGLTMNNAAIGRNHDGLNRANVINGVEAVVYGEVSKDTLYVSPHKYAFTTDCMTGENIIELDVNGYYVFIHKDLWDKLDHEKYKDIYMEGNDEYLIVREKYRKEPFYGKAFP